MRLLRTADVFLLAAICWPSLGAPCADGPAETAPSPLRFPVGQVARYSGSIVLKQLIDGQVETELRLQARLAYRVKEQGANQGKLLLVRVIKPPPDPAVEAKEEEGEEGSGAQDLEGALGALELASVEEKKGALRLEVHEDAAPELKEVLANLAVYFPMDAVFPSFPSVREGMTHEGKAEISILGMAKLQAPLATRLRPAAGGGAGGGAFELERQLVPKEGANDGGARLPAFEFQESPASLVEWREVYTLDPAAGSVLRSERQAAFEFKVVEPSEDASEESKKEVKYRIEVKGRLERTHLSLAPAEEAKRLDELETKMAAAAKAFAERRPSAEIDRLVAAAAGAAAGTALEDAGDALAVRLRAFRELFEGSDSGRRLAALLGKPAPDFTLADLEGKKVRFREAIRGKVTLLSFWGFG